MPRYKSMKTLKSGNPALFEVIQFIGDMYEYHRNNEIKTGFFTMQAVHFAVRGSEYQLALKIEDGELTHNFERRSKRARKYEPISIRTVRALVRRAI